MDMSANGLMIVFNKFYTSNILWIPIYFVFPWGYWCAKIVSFLAFNCTFNYWSVTLTLIGIAAL